MKLYLQDQKAEDLVDKVSFQTKTNFINSQIFDHFDYVFETFESFTDFSLKTECKERKSSYFPRFVLNGNVFNGTLHFIKKRNLAIIITFLINGFRRMTLFGNIFVLFFSM